MASQRAGPTPPTMDPAQIVIGAVMADGTVKLTDCAECPYRQVLCHVCVVPGILADPDLEENNFPDAG
jgi:hypothetical protein